MEEKLAKMVSLLLVVWFLAWTPYATMSCWIMFFNAEGLSPVMALVPTLCCKVSAATNAMLYGLRYYFCELLKKIHFQIDFSDSSANFN